jgi:glycosyltransferase involved in cell wall biosynthesis
VSVWSRLRQALKPQRPPRVSLFNVHMITDDAVGQSVLIQARAFKKHGADVRIYCQYVPPSAPAEVIALSRVEDLTLVEDEHFRRSDLYVFHYPSRYTLMDAIAKTGPGGVIFHFHNVTPPEFWTSDDDRAVLRRSIDGVRELAPYADLVVTPSAFNADELVTLHGCPRDRVRVLPLAAPTDQFHPGPRDAVLVDQYRLRDRRVILFVGRMAGNKRVDLLLDALAFVVRDVPEALLLLVGDADSDPSFVANVETIRTRAESLGLADRVVVTGKVDDLPRYYRLADVYATASLHEGFGVPLIEAMASGVPVVASRATAHPWVVQDAGLLAAPDDAADLAHQIVRVLTDDPLRAALIERGAARAREFGLDRYEEGLEHVSAEAIALAAAASSAPRPRWRPTA